MFIEQMTHGEPTSKGVNHLVEQFDALPGNIQRLLIGTAFLTALVGKVIVRNKIDEARLAISAEAPQESLEPIDSSFQG